MHGSTNIVIYVTSNEIGNKSDVTNVLFGTNQVSKSLNKFIRIVHNCIRLCLTNPMTLFEDVSSSVGEFPQFCDETSAPLLEVLLGSSYNW